MRAEDYTGSFRHLAKLFDENCSGAAQLIDDVAIVDNFLAHIDRRAKRLQRNLYDVNRPHHAGAEATRLQQENSLGFSRIAALGNRSRVKGGCSHASQYTASIRPLERN